MEFSQRDLFKVFAEVDRKSGNFTYLSTDVYLDALVEKLPVDIRDKQRVDKDIFKNCLHAYKKKKSKRGKLSLVELAEKGSDDIIIVVYPNESLIENIDLTIVNDIDMLTFHSDENIIDLDEKPPNKKRKSAELFTTSFSKSYKSFYDMSDKQKRNITAPLISLLEKFIDTNDFEMTTNQLLGYLLLRQNNKSNNACAKIGRSIYEKKEDQVVEFSPIEAVSLKHALVLSKDQTRKVKDFLGMKNVKFPSTNEILPVRKSLRPDKFSIFSGKGRALDYKDLVHHTVSSVLKVVYEMSCLQRGSYKIYLKDGGDGAGTMPVIKTKSAIDDVDHVFQYGIIPLKLTLLNEADQEDVIWSNPVPNSARSLRPIYLVREIETNPELLDEVIVKSDKAREELGNVGIIMEDGTTVEIDIKDTMKDLKFKKCISGLGGAACLLCKSKVEDWTDVTRVKSGFPIDRTAADTREIFNSVVDENGNIRRSPGDFNVRSGVTKKPLSTSDQHSITITHSYINACTWYMKMLYRCYSDHQIWDEKKTIYGDPIRNAKDPVRDLIREETGLVLDFVNSAGGKGGTSTTGEQARRFFTEGSKRAIEILLSKQHNKKHQHNMIKLHEQLSIVLRVISCLRKINIPAFKKHCMDTAINISENFEWAKINHTLHGALQHSCELIELNGGESLGWYSEEGLEANNKDIRRYLEKLSRKNCRNKQIEDVHNRLLERSDPYLIHMTSQYMAKKGCRECGASDHTIRSHSKYSSTLQDELIMNFFL